MFEYITGAENRDAAGSRRYRAGEYPQTRFRSERFCRVNGQWYFMVRDDAPQGPFATRRQAEGELAFYLRTLCLLGKASIEPESPQLFSSLA